MDEQFKEIDFRAVKKAYDEAFENMAQSFIQLSMASHRLNQTINELRQEHPTLFHD